MNNAIKFSMVAAAMALAACGGETAIANQNGTEGGNTVAGGDTSRNWAEVVSQTPEGGFVMGNPDAPVKVVEYASLTCPHCAQFSATAVPPLTEEYIRQGTVSFEIRNFVRDPLDLAAAVLSRCNGAEPYFQITERMFANQQNMITTVQGVDQAQLQAISGLPPAQQMGRFAELAGLVDFVGGLGIPAQRAQQCLADTAAIGQLESLRNGAISQYNLPGTPAFLINGELQQNVYDWPSLKTQIDAAIQ